jgi:hypothetical protein
MSRGLPQSVIDAFGSNGFNYATLVQINRRNSGSFFMTDYGINLTYQNIEYLSSELLLEVASVKESQALQVNDMSLTLSGANQTFISSFLNDPNFIADRVLIYKAVLNESNNINGAFLQFDGRISEYGIEEDEESSTVELTVASHWADFEKLNGRKTNNNIQRLYYPDDVGFEYASVIVKDLKWGRE